MTTGPSQVLDGEARRAGFVTRAAAFAVDAVILSGMLGGTAWLLNVTAMGFRRFAPTADLVPVLFAVAPVLVAGYHIAFWTLAGQTPGKWLLGIRIHTPDGKRPSVVRASLRWVGYFVSAIPLYLGFLWVLGPARRAWHDRLAGTEVSYVPKPVPASSLGGVLRRRWTRGHAPPLGPNP